MLLRHAKDFIPQMVEFKLSAVINGGSTSKATVGVFPDSPQVGKIYVPSKLRTVMKRLEKGELSDHDEEEDEESENEPDYIIDEVKKKERVVRPGRDERFVPLNIYDLYEQANPRFANGAVSQAQ